MSFGNREGHYLLRTGDDLGLVFEVLGTSLEASRLRAAEQSHEQPVRLELVTVDDGETVETELVAAYENGTETE